MTGGSADLRLVLPAAAGWAAGAALLGAPARAGLAAAGVLGLLALITARRPAVAATAVGAAAVAFVTALHAGQVAAGPLPGLADRGAAVTLDVRITGDPVVHAGRVSGSTLFSRSVTVPATAEQVQTGGRAARIRSPVLVIGRGDGWRALLPSQRLRVHGRVTRPDRAGDLTAVVLADGPPDRVTSPSAVQAAAGHVRAGLRAAAGVLPTEPRGLLPGLVDGDVSRMPSGLVDDFRTAGLTHLTAVSGANVAIVLAVVLGLARRLRVPARVAPVVGLVALALFVLLARPSPSVVRAAAMGMVVIVGMLGGRRGAPLAALGAAVLALLLISPSLARSPGLALSVLATGALLVVAPRWAAVLDRRLPRWLAEPVAIAAAAQVFCAPVIAAIGGDVSLVAVPANLLAAPAVAPATVLGVAAAVIAPVLLPVAQALAWVAGWPTRWLVIVAHESAAAPHATFPWPAGLAGGAALTVVLVAAVAVVRRRALRRWGSAGLAGVVVAVVGLHALAPGWPPPGWLFVACAVGQGDALVLRVAPDTAVVVDAGPDPRAVDRCLRDLGVRRVPLVLLSHFHADHVEGLPGVLRHRAVGEIEVGPLDAPVDERRRVLGWAARARVPVHVAQSGERRRAGDLEWQVIAPLVVLHGTSSDPNNDSLVLRAESGGITLLLTGDVEPEAQQALLDHAAGLQADVLKIPHHGSSHQDPAFLDTVRATVAVASVGADNPYGHPAPATLGRLRRDGARVYRTDRDGDVAVCRRDGRLVVVARG